MTLSDPPVRSRRRARAWALGMLCAAAVVSSALLTVESGSAATRAGAIAPDMGQTGASPVPQVAPVLATTKFNIATFNVLGYDHTIPGGSHRGYRDGGARMRAATQLIVENNLDVVGMQELQPQQYDRFAKRLSSTYDIWPGNIETVGFLRNSIAWRRDKFTMVANTWVKLPYFKGDVLRMPVVLLRSSTTGQQFYVMNFQNPANTRGNAEQWRLLGQRIQIALVNQLRVSNNLPLLWIGDLNAKKQAFCRVTAETGMVSASGGSGALGSCTPPRNMVVDWIFGSGVQFKKYQQLRSNKVRRATDHHLVLSKVILQPQVATVPPPPSPVVTCSTTTTTPTPTLPPTTLPPTTGAPTAVPTPTPTPTGTPTPTPTVATPTPVTSCLTTTPSPQIFTTAP